jgi:hypothetical protein
MKLDLSLDQLNNFIVQAKAATYAGDGPKAASSRPKSLDLQFSDGDFSYIDSYFGGADFLGQEVVYYQGEPVWAMNYYGRILEPERIEAAEAGQIIQQSLSAMYQENRFLGGFEFTIDSDRYIDTSQGDLTMFTGTEWIEREGVRVYDLVYHGGLVKW